MEHVYLEKRRHQRFETSIPALVHTKRKTLSSKISRYDSAQIINISLSGALVSIPLKKENAFAFHADEFVLMFDDPKNTNGTNNIWCRPCRIDRNDTTLFVGIEFCQVFQCDWIPEEYVN
ncbi:PilZ domain-containing protein [Desulfovibrio inopinatus]|uniref:PilZ domain-containing protein n=1 Tax=Desulfovibrio inopinatus TaxID=102109 RepID=UPI000484130B|nr:PilZ domain-containing protein [Desulfovibrio inopinatus]